MNQIILDPSFSSHTMISESAKALAAMMLFGREPPFVGSKHSGQSITIHEC